MVAHNKAISPGDDALILGGGSIVGGVLTCRCSGRIVGRTRRSTFIPDLNEFYAVCEDCGTEYEHIGYMPRALTPVEVDEVRGYLEKKWGSGSQG